MEDEARKTDSYTFIEPPADIERYKNMDKGYEPFQFLKGYKLRAKPETDPVEYETAPSIQEVITI